MLELSITMVKLKERNLRDEVILYLVIFFFFLNIGVVSAVGCWKADANGDGSVNLIDMSLVKSKDGCAVSEGNCWAYDINSDGNVNLIDMSLVKSMDGCVIELQLSPVEDCFWFDADLDGDVDGADEALFYSCKNGAIQEPCQRFDYDSDGDVDDADEAALASCHSGNKVPYTGLTPEIYYSLNTYRIIEESIVGREVADTLELTDEERALVLDFVENSDSGGAVIINERVLQGDNLLSHFHDTVTDKYYLTTSNGDRFVVSERERMYENCVVSDGSDFSSIYFDVHCVFAQIRAENMSSSPYFADNIAAIDALNDALLQWKNSGKVEDYQIGTDFGDDWVWLNLTGSDNYADFKVELSHDDYYGPAPDMDFLVEELTETLEDGGFIVFDDNLPYGIYITDKKELVRLLNYTLTEDEFKEATETVISVISERNSDIIDCKKDSLRIFETTTDYTWDDIQNQSLASADALCMAGADAAGLEGVYKAWLSTPEVNANQRFLSDNMEFVNLNGEIVASDFNDLIDGSLDNPIGSGLNVVTMSDESGFYADGEACRSCLKFDSDGDGELGAGDKIAFLECYNRVDGAERKLFESNEQEKVTDVSDMHAAYTIGPWGSGDVGLAHLVEGEMFRTNTADLIEKLPRVNDEIFVYFTNNSELFYCELESCANEQIKAADAVGIDEIELDGNVIKWKDMDENWSYCNVELNGQDGGCLLDDVKTQGDLGPVEQYKVWSENVGGDNHEIFYCEQGIDRECIGDEIRVTSTDRFDRFPDVSGNQIVWNWGYGVSSPTTIYRCDILMNRQAGGCLEGDSKTRIGSSGTNRNPAVNPRGAVAWSRWIGWMTWPSGGQSENYDLFVYDEYYDPVDGCEEFDANRDGIIDTSDRAIFDSCYFGHIESFGGSLTAGDSGSVSGWSSNVSVPACGRRNTLNLYCIEQLEEWCYEESAPVTQRASAKSKNTLDYPVLTEPPAKYYYQELGGSVPYKSGALLIEIMPPGSRYDGLIANKFEEKFMELSKRDYKPDFKRLWPEKLILDDMDLPVEFPDVLDYLEKKFEDKSIQQYMVLTHGSKSGRLQINCYNSVFESTMAANKLITTGKVKKEEISVGGMGSCSIKNTGQGQKFVNGSALFINNAYFANKFSNFQKALYLAAQCYGATWGNSDGWLNEVISFHAGTPGSTDAALWDLKVFLEYYMNEKRYGLKDYTEAGIFSDAAEVVDKVPTKFFYENGINDYQKSSVKCKKFFLGIQYDTFCMWDDVGGIGPSPRATPTVVGVGSSPVSMSLNFDSPMQGKPGQVVPENVLEINYEGCLADWEKNPEMLNSLFASEPTWLPAAQESFEDWKKQYLSNLPYNKKPIWKNNNMAGFSNEFGNYVEWEMSWYPTPYSYWCVDDYESYYQSFSEYHVNEGTRLIDFTRWNNLDKSLRDNWPESQYLKIRLNAEKVGSYQAGIHVSGNDLASTEGNFLKKEAYNIHGTTTKNGADLDERLYPFVYYNGGTYNGYYEVWIPCSKPRFVCT